MSCVKCLCLTLPSTSTTQTSKAHTYHLLAAGFCSWNVLQHNTYSWNLIIASSNCNDNNVVQAEAELCVAAAGKFFWFLLYTYLTQVYFTFFGESPITSFIRHAYTTPNILIQIECL